MSSKLLVFALITSVVVSGALSMINSAFAQTPVWYPGEGVKQGMYVKYRIQDYDTNERQPYVLTLYFQQQDQDGNWIVPAYVEANGRVLQGTLKLSEGMSPLAGGEVPQEMNQFVGGYQNSLLWLDAASSIFEPLSLTAGSWGKIAAIGGQEVRPVGTEQVQFAGAPAVCGSTTCASTLISWHKGVDSKVWVVNEFPFPVKAETYADVTTPPQPIQYAYELLDTGSGQPPAPTATGGAPQPPLDRTTTDGSHVILTWNPVDIQPNSAVNFGVEFRDARNAPLNGVSYEFLAKDANGPVVQQLSDQYAQSGTSSQQVTFNSPGPKTILVTINAVGSRPTGQLIESTDFNIVVAGTNATTGGAAAGGTNATTGGAAAGGTNATIPEFSTVAIVVLAIAIVGIIIATSRQGRFSFGQRM
ncbi:MAG: PEFG-CTERM sorting domain-containing protein [Thermoproteota archaeon]|nr:PEFG-CTERM sorting domain-containing protein [Thermoproteota archaeon]